MNVFCGLLGRNVRLVKVYVNLRGLICGTVNAIQVLWRVKVGRKHPWKLPIYLGWEQLKHRRGNFAEKFLRLQYTSIKKWSFWTVCVDRCMDVLDDCFLQSFTAQNLVKMFFLQCWSPEQWSQHRFWRKMFEVKIINLTWSSHWRTVWRALYFVVLQNWNFRHFSHPFH